MDKQSLLTKLRAYGLDPKQIDDAMVLIEHFNEFMVMPGHNPCFETAWAFSDLMITRQINTFENYLTLYRYCAFIRERELQVAFLELIDGGEVAENLYNKMGQQWGEDLKNVVFSGSGIIAYGTPTPEKPAYLHPIIKRLKEQVGSDAVCQFLSVCMRDLPDEMAAGMIEQFNEAGDIDAFLVQRKARFIETLEQCMKADRLFFAQPITPEVIDFVRSDPEMGAGRREGNVLYETKIPFLTSQYLSESDPKMRRYYYCHCPWTREAIKAGNVEIAPEFCNCSGGFHKKDWEAIYGQPLKVEVLESVAQGDDRCRFAIHLPEIGNL